MLSRTTSSARAYLQHARPVARRGRLGHALLASLLALGVQWANAQPAGDGQPQLNLPRTALTAGMFRIDAQLALTPEQREIGLMYRHDMPEHEGMLFVFEQPGVQCFWMKNTRLPLSAAFVADDGRIVNIADMAPQTLNSHCSAEPVRYVLEMNQGWFAKRHVQTGSKLGGPAFESGGVNAP